MADEIQINPATNGNSSVQGQAAGNAAAAGQTGTGFVKSDGVIDLRALDQVDQKTVSGAGTAGNTGTQGTPPVATAATGATPVNVAPAKKNAVMLDDDAGTGAQPAPAKKTIPLNVAAKFPDLQQLIDETESMNDSERDYWYQVLPIMTDDQIKKFRDILVNEKVQLKKLDKEYEQELVKLNEKHMIEWQDFQSKEKRKALTQAEQASKANEQATEEELLQRLSQV